MFVAGSPELTTDAGAPPLLVRAKTELTPPPSKSSEKTISAWQARGRANAMAAAKVDLDMVRRVWNLRRVLASLREQAGAQKV